MTVTRLIDVQHSKDINLPNEPFKLFGRLIPKYSDGKWSWKTELFAPENASEMRFPDENYDFEQMSENSTFIGAYDGECDDESIRGAAGGADAENCIGLAIMQEGFFKYMYLYDLKVSAAARGRGIGMKLIERAKELAREKGYRGIYVIAQDNNLGACLFYLKCGFRIGGFDTEVYRGTAQEGKSDIIFYLDC